MAKRVSKYIAILFFVSFGIIILSILFINQIINSSYTKKAISSIAKNLSSYDVAYNNITFDILNSKLKIDKLYVDGKDLKIKLGNIVISRKNRKNYIYIENGTIDILEIKPSKKKKETPANIETPFYKVEAKNINVNIINSNLNIERMNLTENKNFYIKAKLEKEDQIELEGSYSEYILSSVIKELNVKSTNITKLLKNLKIDPPDINLLKKSNLVALKGTKISGNLKNSTFEINISKLNINDKNSSATIGDDNNKANITLKINPSLITVSGSIEKGQLSNFYDLILKIYKVDVIEQLKNIVENSNVSNLNISVEIPLYSKFDVRKININGYISNGSINIPKTELKCVINYAYIILENGTVNTTITKGTTETLNFSGNFTMNILNEKLPFSTNIDFDGDMSGLNNIFAKIEDLKNLQNIIKINNGRINGKLYINSAENFDIFIEGIFENANLNVNKIKSTISIKTANFRIDNDNINIDIANLSTDSLKSNNAKFVSDGKKHAIEILEGEIDIDRFKNEEIYTNITSNFKDKFEIISGKSKIDKLNVILSDKVENVDITGNLNDIFIKTIDKQNIPFEVANIHKAKFYLNYPQKISAKDIDLNIDKTQHIYIENFDFDLNKNYLNLKCETKYSHYIENILSKYIGKNLDITPKYNDMIVLDGNINLNDKSLSGDLVIIRANKKVDITDINYKDNILTSKFKLECKNSKAKGNIKIINDKNYVEGAVSGNVTLDCLKEAFDIRVKYPEFALIQTDFYFKLNLKEPSEFTLEGPLQINSLKLDGNQVDISLDSRGKVIEVSSIYIESPYGNAGGFGKVERLDGKLLIDLFLQGRSIDIDLILSKLAKDSKDSGKDKSIPIPILVRINFDFSRAKLIDRNFSDLKGNFTLDTDRGIKILVNTVDTDLCGIRFDANFSMEGDYKKLRITGRGNGDLAKTITCLTGKEEKIITGTYGYVIDANIEGIDIEKLEKAKGEIQFLSEEGRIHKLTVIAKILEMLNFYKLLTFQITDLAKEGFKYNYLILQAKLKNNKVLIDDSYIDSDALKIWSEGSIDFKGKKLNMVVLAAPFSTIDKILSKLPIIGPVFLGKSKTLLSIPFKVKGPLDDPVVQPLDPSLIGKGILNLIKRILKAPIYIFPTEEE